MIVRQGRVILCKVGIELAGFVRGGIFRRQEIEKDAHQVWAFACGEEKLRVRRAIENDQLVRLGGLFAVARYGGQARAGAVGVVAGNNKEFAAAEVLGMVAAV